MACILGRYHPAIVRVRIYLSFHGTLHTYLFIRNYDFGAENVNTTRPIASFDVSIWAFVSMAFYEARNYRAVIYLSIGNKFYMGRYVLLMQPTHEKIFGTRVDIGFVEKFRSRKREKTRTVRVMDKRTADLKSAPLVY